MDSLFSSEGYYPAASPLWQDVFRRQMDISWCPLPCPGAHFQGKNKKSVNRKMQLKIGRSHEAVGRSHFSMIIVIFKFKKIIVNRILHCSLQFHFSVPWLWEEGCRNNIHVVWKEVFIEVAPVQEDERRLPKNHPKVVRLGGGFKHFYFSPPFGEMIQFDSYFSKGLKPPTKRLIKTTACQIHLPGAPPPPFGPVPPLPCAARRWAEVAVWRRCHEKPHGRFFWTKTQGGFFNGLYL